MSAPATTAPPRAARLAVSVLFLVNAFGATSLVPRLPEIRDGLGLSDTALGIAVAAGGLGALVASIASGPLVHRFGSGRTAVAFGVLLSLAVVGPGVAPAWGLLVVAYLLAGAVDAVMDVAMNAQGLVVQTRYGRSVLNGFHGWWSIGSGAGALCGAGAAAAGVPLGVHLGAVAAVSVVAVLGASRQLLPDPLEADETGAETVRPSRPAFGVLARSLGPLVLFSFLITYVEDAPATWSAIYLTDVLTTPAGVAGLGFVAFAVGMTVGRMSADRVVDRFGLVRVAQAGGLLTALGWAGLLLGPSPAATFAGLAVAGLGVSPLFPAMFTAAAARPGVPAAYGLAVASWAARFGFMLAPPVVGALSDARGLPLALATVVVGALGIVVAALALRPARGDGHRDPGSSRNLSPST